MEGAVVTGEGALGLAGREYGVGFRKSQFHY